MEEQKENLIIKDLEKESQSSPTGSGSDISKNTSLLLSSNFDTAPISSPKYNRPRSFTCPTSLQAHSLSRTLKYGSKVVILPTENVEQRVPQYVGMEGTVVDVPVHPATWFKVQFANGVILTFRPSALRLVTEDGHLSNENLVFQKPKKKDGVESPHQVRQPSKPHNLPNPLTTSALTSVDPTTWVNKKVRIAGGKYNGQVALVKSSGNGWVQLVSNFGEIAKRATELTLLADDDPSEVTVGMTADHPTKRPRGDSDDFGKSIAPRRRSNSEPAHYFYNQYNSPLKHMAPKNDSAANTVISSQNSTSEATTSTSTKGSLVDGKTMQLQKEAIQRYIDRQKNKYRNRPDLKYWLQQIKGTTIDTSYEMLLARDIKEQFCSSCGLEKWSSSKFCWNELCEDSPIYWKLPGAAGTPPFDRAEIAAQALVEMQRSNSIDFSPKTHVKSPRTTEKRRDSFGQSSPRASQKNITPPVSKKIGVNVVSEFIQNAPFLCLDARDNAEIEPLINPAIIAANKQAQQRSESGGTDNEDTVEHVPSLLSQPRLLVHRQQLPSNAILKGIVPKSPSTMPLAGIKPKAKISNINIDATKVENKQKKFKSNNMSPLPLPLRSPLGSPPASHEEFARLIAPVTLPTGNLLSSSVPLKPLTSFVKPHNS